MRAGVLAARHWILDVDGCLVRTAKPGGAGGSAMGRARDLVAWLKSSGRTVIVCTNASQRPPAEYAAHLRELGIDVENEEFVTAGTAAADYIAATHPEGRVLVVGDEGVRDPLRRLGMTLADGGRDQGLPDVVICGAADGYTTANINAACLAVEAGAAFYATHHSPWFHGGATKSVAITAAIAAAIAWTAGIQPTVLGKPSAALAATLLDRLGGDGSAITVVGDAEAEVRLARHMAAHSVAVLSGALTLGGMEALTAKPDLVVADVAALLALLEGADDGEQSLGKNDHE